QILDKTIKQIIGWAWKEAEKTGVKQTDNKTMNDDIEKLINQGTVCLNTNDTQQWEQFKRNLSLTLKRLESSLTRQLMTLTSEIQIRTFLQVNLPRIVDLSDDMLAAGSVHRDTSKQIAGLVESVAKSMMHLLSPTFPLPEVFRQEVWASIADRCNTINQRLEAHGIDPLLAKVCLSAFERFGNGNRKPHWSRYWYLKEFLAYLEEYTLTDKEPDDWKFVEALIAYGFNSVRFSAYVCGQIR